MIDLLTVCVRLLPSGVTEILAAGIPPKTHSHSNENPNEMIT